LKLFYLILSTAVSFSSYAQQNTLAIKKNINQAGRIACEQTILAYPNLRDHGPVIKYGALFSQDAIFNVKKYSISLQGRSKIIERLESALRTTQTHHIVSDVKIEHISEKKYKSHAYFTLNLKKLTPQQSPPVNITGHYEDLLQFDGNKCLIVSRQVNIDSPKS